MDSQCLFCELRHQVRTDVGKSHDASVCGTTGPSPSPSGDISAAKKEDNQDIPTLKTPADSADAKVTELSNPCHAE